MIYPKVHLLISQPSHLGKISVKPPICISVIVNPPVIMIWGFPKSWGWPQIIQVMDNQTIDTYAGSSILGNLHLAPLV